METEPESGSPQARVRWNRGLSTVTAAVVMIVVIIVVGAGAYVAFAATGPSSKTLTTCTPPSSPVCAQISNAHDLAVLAPFKSAQTGNAVPFTALLPGGQSSTSFTFDFGDGSKKVTSSSSTVDHTYTNPGEFIVQASATVGGALHDNLHALTLVTIAASGANPQAGNLPHVSGTIVSNDSSTSAPTTILQVGGKVTVKGSYIGAPTNPAFALATPTISTSGGTTSGAANTPASAQATVTFGSAGTYVVNFVGSAKSGTTTVFQNFTWTVVVAPSGVHAGTSGKAVTTSPHKGSLIVYEEAPGGAQSLDPAIAYDTVSYEPILNVYQGLIAYNGSSAGPDPSDYYPVLATCVPGSALCQKQWGTPLWTAGSANWTFVVDPNAQFYDPHTGAHWGVYPSDVVFSVARTMGFADLPCSGCHNGWILTQSLLPAGNPAWDTALVGYGMHAPYNNTPQNVFNSVSVNDTAAGCPAAAMMKAHGCVTFHATGLGEPWPYFLELIGDQLGASVVPCGWFSAPAQGAGIPDWTTGSVSTAISGNGDHPCLLPGGTTSTTDPRFQPAVNAIPVTGWDNWEGAGSGTTNGGGSIGTVIGAMVGSGPYYLSDYRIGLSYALKANPDYKANPACASPFCEPAPGQYASNIQVTWESTATPGEQAFASGSADFASIPGVDTALAIQLIQQGKIAATSYPSISVFFHPFDMNFSVAGAQKFIPEPVNVPGDFFNYLGLRQFLVHSYPYDTIQSTVNTKLGIQFGFNYGGVIPNFMANYYPANISFPSGDPCTATNNPQCAGYWWAQITSPSSPYYDPEVAKCSATAPCSFPNFGENGAPDEDQRIALWDNSIQTLSHGALVPRAVDINFIDLVINSLFSSPGTNPMPLYTLGWAPDYPDPTDYIGPMWAADSTYTFGDSVLESMSAFNATGCSTDFHVYAAMTSVLPQKCEGAAYAAMQNAIAQAAVAPAGPGRVWLYNQVERIGNQLALYQYSLQTNQVWYYASWVNGATINQNVVIGGGGDSTWWSVGGNGVF